jgi:hypothetical protein
MASHSGVKQVGLLTLVCPDLTRSALEKRHPWFPSFSSSSSWLTIANGTWERSPGMTVAHGLATVETRTMKRGRRGNSTAGYVGYFLRLFVNTQDSLRVGMMEDKTPITTTKITVREGVHFKVIRSVSLLATPVRTSSSLVSTLVSQNPTFVALFTITL